MVDISEHADKIREYMNMTSVHDPRSAFLGLLLSYGFTPPRNPLFDGRIDRIDSPEDSRVGKLSGWYWYNEYDVGDDIIGVARFGCWKGGWSEQWASKSLHHMTHRESAIYQEAQRQARIAAEIEERRRHEEAAIKAMEIYKNAAPASVDAPYLLRKGITPCPLIRETYDNYDRYGCSELIVPVTANGELLSLQFIKNEGDYLIKGNPIGNKKMMSGGKTKGCYLYLGGNKDIVYICEGYATGRSINMATGNVVNICFSANNIYNAVAVVKEDYPDSVIIICGDDDIETKGNPGREKATQAADALGVRVLFPVDGGDFNDMHVKYGIDAVRNLVKPQDIEEIREQLKKKNSIEHNNDIIIRPSGVLGHIFDYYNATSGIYQPGFAIQTAIAICSVILGRSYKTSQNNYTSLFFMNIGESSTGKEHIKKITENILEETDKTHMLGGDGFTSPGSIFTALMRNPIKISTIDEMGIYLKHCKEGGANTMSDAVATLMQAITRNDGVLRSRDYSAMSGSNNKDDINNRNIKNPALTLVGNTTPSTFYDSVDIEAVKSGFLNRFMIYHSSVEMQIWEEVPQVDLPDRIIDWVSVVTARHGGKHIFNESAKPIVIKFSDEANVIVREYKYWALERQKELRKAGIDKMAARLAEWAMRLSLIVALSRNPMTETVEKQDIEWAIYWSKLCFDKTLKSIRAFMAYSEHDKERDVIYKALIEQGAEGISFKSMMSTPPFKGHSKKKLSQLLDELREADLVIESSPTNTTGRGRRSPIWVAL